jgi:hypothetical protein
MNRNIISRSIFTLAALAFAGCATPEAETEHLQEGGVGVTEAGITWGMGIPYPDRFVPKPGDDVVRYTESCEIDSDPEHRVGPLTCRDRAEAECRDDGGLPIPGYLLRYSADCGDEGCVTVTSKCLFRAGDES